jgi:hypothetical protein
MDTSDVCVYPELKLGIGWLRGVVTGQDLIRGIQALYSDQRWQPGYATLWVCVEATEIVCLLRDVDDIIAVLEASRKQRSKGKLAFVVRRDVEHDLFYLLTVKDRASQRPSALFRNMRDALTWLGVDEKAARLAGLV